MSDGVRSSEGDFARTDALTSNAVGQLQTVRSLDAFLRTADVPLFLMYAKGATAPRNSMVIVRALSDSDAW